jgi:hypothetical protein
MTSNRTLRSLIDHILIGLVIVLGTSMVTMAANIEKAHPGITLYERVMLMLPCSK